MKKNFFKKFSAAAVILVVLFSLFAAPVCETQASDLPSGYNSKMVKAYGNSGYAASLTLYQMMMVAYGANTFQNYYKTTGAGNNNWSYRNYWKRPWLGGTTRRWNSYSEMKDAGVLPKAGDIIIYCNGLDIGTNYNGDTVSMTHSGVVVTDTNSNGVFYVMEGCYSETNAVVLNKRRISTQYTNYSRLDEDPYSVYGGHYKLYAIIRNESSEVRNYMVQTAFSEKAKFDRNHSAYIRQLHSDMSYDGYWCVGFVARVALEHPTVGQLGLRASSSSGLVPSNFFEGATYRIYRDSECIFPAGPPAAITLKIDKTGRSSKKVPLAPGTYYIKQTAAPSNGLFKLSTSYSKVTVEKDRTVTFSSGNLVMTPISSSALKAALAEEAAKTGTSFWDVASDDPLAPAVMWAVEQGIASGYTGEKAGYFGLDESVTRGQVAMMLWRAAGKPAPSGKTQQFADVPKDHSFFKAIQWAYENGIASGYTGERAGYFGISDPCTRGQITMFIWRAAGKPAPSGKTQQFADVPADHSFFKAILWAYESHISYGYSDGTFGIGKTCTRGQCVYFLYKWLSR